MNEKFEKWFSESHMICKGDALKTWQAALQSLEVTPDLLKSAIDGFDRLHDLRDEDGKRILKNDECLRRTITAVFNAIKEQAK